MKKIFTRKQQILFLLDKPQTKMTCSEICEEIVRFEKIPSDSSVARYLSGSISSILAKLVKEKTLKYAKEKGPKGGHVYQLNA